MDLDVYIFVLLLQFIGEGGGIEECCLDNTRQTKPRKFFGQSEPLSESRELWTV